MNKTIKKIITSIIISTITLGIGFGLTMVSFNLFGTLTPNQMKMLFAVDVICLVAVVGTFLFFLDKKSIEAKRQAQFEKRRSKRIEDIANQYAIVESIISSSNFAA